MLLAAVAAAWTLQSPADEPEVGCTGLPITLPADKFTDFDFLHQVAAVEADTAGGLYYRKSGTNSFRTQNSAWSLDWTGCSWKITRAYATVLDDGVANCTDDNDAANALFRQSDQDADICASAKTAGFCAVSYLKAACPASCGVAKGDCHGDDEDAAADLFAALGLDTTTCAQQVDLCGKDHVKAVCKETCGHGSAIPAGFLDGEADTLADLGARRLLSLDHTAQLRRLATWQETLDVDDFDYRTKYVVYSKEVLNNLTETFFADGATAEFKDVAEGCPAATDQEVFRTCDPTKVLEEVGSVAHSCTELTGYDTTSSAFCPWVNLDVPPDAELAAQSCFSNPTRAGFENDNEHSNALCLPREQCEALCSTRESCTGVDVLIGKPRCWLNRAHEDFCSVDTIYIGTGGLTPPTGWYHPDGYGVKCGVRFPDGHVNRRLGAGEAVRRLGGTELWASTTHNFLRKKQAATVWVTTTGQACDANSVNVTASGSAKACSACNGACTTTGAANYEDDLFAVCSSREGCEAECGATAGCIGFVMDPINQACWLKTAACAADDVQNTGNFVTKTAADACTVTLTLDGAAGGTYTQVDATTFAHAANDYQIKHGDLGGYWSVRSASSGLADYAVGASTTVLAFTDSTGLTWDGWATATLHYALCPPAEVELDFHCIGDNMCPTLGYCMLSPDRLKLELTTLRNEAVTENAMCDELSDEDASARIQAYKPKIVASKSRLEAVFDSTAFLGAADASYLHQELFRDASSRRIRVQSLGPGRDVNGTAREFGRGVVTLVDPEDAVLTLGGANLPPQGYAPWVTDLIRVERYAETGDKITGPMTLEFHLGERPVDLFWWSGGEWANIGTVTKSDVHHEAGWWTATVDPDADFTACSILIAGTVDVDECANGGGGCEENQICINEVGTAAGYRCECAQGWRVATDNANECVALKWLPENLQVRVENNAAFDLGWRVQEVELFSDTTCTTPLLDAAGTWHWVTFEDSYCLGNNGVLGAASEHLCRKKCSAQGKGDCAGYVNADKTSSALCMQKQACMDLCGATEGCVGVDVHEYLPRCYMNIETGAEGDIPCTEQARDPAKRGVDVHYEFWLRSKVTAVTASSSFESHPPSLTNDGSSNSEWWSNVFRAGPREQWLDYSVSAFAAVKGVRVRQRPGHHVSSYRVHVGVGRSTLDRPDIGSHVQHAEAGAEVEDRSLYTRSVIVNAGEESPCVDVTCGTSVKFRNPAKADILESYGNVPSPCHCKQLCLDHVDEGCRSWVWSRGADSNYWQDAASHVHQRCYLLTSPPEADNSCTPGETAVSGGVDLVLFGAAVVDAPAGGLQGGEQVTVVVTGAGLPVRTDKQRIKVVRGESCDAPLAAEVAGISCSSPHICTPPPEKAEAGKSAGWKVTFRPAAEAAQYSVCYCAGLCYSSGQWTKVPGVIDVAGKTPWEVTPAALTRQSATASLNFGEDVTAAALDVSPQCEGAEAGWTERANVAEAFNYAIDGSDASLVTVTINDAAKYGNYSVCVKTDGDWFSVPGVAGPFLTISPSEDDAVRADGVFRGQSWSMSSGTAEIAVAGAGLNEATQKVALANSNETCASGPPAAASWRNASKAGAALEKSTATSLVYEVTVTKAGSYPVCICVVDDCTQAGSLHVTERVDVDKNWVLDPAATKHSIEITGSGLDWKKDRIMAVDCQTTCGGDASLHVKAGGAWAETSALADVWGQPGEGTEPYSVDAKYQTVESRYCRGNNLELSSHTLAEKHGCFSKCSNGCTGDACFCDGFLQGHDDASSTAVCLNQVECTALCTIMDGCSSVDMHGTLNRCFLNGPACDDQVAAEGADGLGVDTNYNLLRKPARRLAVDWQSSSRGNLALHPGLSTAYVLRWKDLAFEGGKFKVCFCDSANRACTSPKDFVIEVGTVHVSGMHCLLSVPKLRTANCYEQYYGGLSCAASWTTPPESAASFPSSEGVIAPSP